MSTDVFAVLEQVRTSVANPKPLPWSLHSGLPVGSFGRQGDIYLTLIDKPQETLRPIDKFNGQLAEGNNRGSRHIVNPQHVEAYQPIGRDIQDGPILRIKQDTTLDHPDHGTVNFEKDTWVSVSYQVNVFADQRSRSKD